jgi:hypothetical protein
MSWRDATPQAIQDDLDLVANVALSAATHLLGRQRGELYPIGVRLPDHGEPEMIGADPGAGEHPASESVLELLYESMRAMRDGTRAVAVAAAVETADGDAVRVEVEHRDGGPALTLLLPYQVTRLGRGVETGDLVAAPGERRVWT